MLRKLREIEPELPTGTLAPDEVRILDYGETDLIRPSGKPIVRRSISPRHRRILVGVAGVALCGLSVWALFQPRTSANPGSPGSRLALGSESASSSTLPTSPLASVPLGTPTRSAWPTAFLPGATPITVPDGGWVVKIDVPIGQGAPALGPVGPDGTIYVAGAVPIGSDGVARPGWLEMSDTGYLQPEVFGPDGSAYAVVEVNGGSAELRAVGPDGLPRYIYPLAFPDHLLLAPGPGSSVYVVAPVTPFQPDQTPAFHVLVIDSYGLLSRDIPLAGEPMQTANGTQFIVFADGSMATTYAASDAVGSCSTHFLYVDGSDRVGADECWENLALSPDGGVVAWSCSRTSDTGTCLETRVALFDSPGRPVAGWPQTLPGAASRPAFGSGGVIYLSTLNAPEGLNQLFAFEPDGSTPAGWAGSFGSPPSLVSDVASSAAEPAQPLIGRDGLVYLQTQTSVAAYVASGELAAGWPVGLPAEPLGPPIYAHRAGEPGMVFAMLEDRIVFLDRDGTEADAFVENASDFAGWDGWAAVSDGIVVLDYHAGNNSAYLLIVFIPAGRP
jgi:hypothetical protein